MSYSALLQSNYRMVESRISTGFLFGFLIATSVPGETPAQEAKPTILTTGPDKEALVPLHPKGLRNSPPYLQHVGYLFRLYSDGGFLSDPFGSSRLLPRFVKWL